MLLLIARIVHAGRRRHAVALAASFVVIVIVGGAVFAATQGYAFSTGLYWAITTASTVGYGDVTPQNAWGRVIASVVMLTTIPLLGALFALATGASVSNGLRRILGMGNEFPTGSYRLIIGMHPTVPAIVAELTDAKDAVVLVADVDASNLPEEIHVIKGDPTHPSVIARARPQGACHALVTGREDGDVLVSTILLRRQAPDVPITALAGSGAVRDALDDLGVSQTLSVDDLVSHTLAKSLEIPHAGGLLHELLDSDDCVLTELDAEQDVVGTLLSEVRRDHDGLVLALVHDGQVTLGIADDPVVAAGDRLLIAVDTASTHHERRRIP